MTLYVMRPEDEWRPWFGELCNARRAGEIRREAEVFWCATERRPAIDDPDGDDSLTADMLRGHLDVRGPVTAAELAVATGATEAEVRAAVAALEGEGFALSGHFTDPDGPEEFCARRVLTRIHAYSRQRKRREVEPVTARDFMRFLLRWQHVAPGTQREGSRGVLAVVEQLQGFELAAGAWERGVLAARVSGYRPEWLDEVCLAGDVTWGRLSVREPAAESVRGLSPSRATPITLTIRDDMPWLMLAARGPAVAVLPSSGCAAEVTDALAGRGALFQADLVDLTGRTPAEIEDALWDGVARGLFTADGFRAVRSLFTRRALDAVPGRQRLRRGGRTSGRLTARTGGRWSLLPPPLGECDPDELAEAVAEQLIVRWGVVFHDLLARENLAVPWREVLWALRRMEARGTVRGGRFVNGFSGEQFAHPDAVEVLKAVRKAPLSGETVRLCAADPLNLTGIVLPGPRIPAVAANSVTYTDGAVPDEGGRPADGGVGADAAAADPAAAAS
jgi:ATP-dependent Lhr-like helicase